MNVLITGGAGYVGAVAASHLAGCGHTVTVVDALRYGGEALLGFHRDDRFRLVKGDVRDTGALAAAMRDVEAVIHLAAVVGEPACSLDPDTADSINVEGTRSTLRVAEAAGVGRLLLVSTCSNYGVSSPENVADEDAPLAPLTGYAEAKVTAEQSVLDHGGPVATTAFRLGTICGLSPRMRFDLLVNELARAAVLHDDMTLYAPEAWRPFLHIRDAARAIAAWLAAPAASINRRVFNVVGENCQKRALAALVRRHFPEAGIHVTDRSADARDYRVSGDRVSRELGFQTIYTVEDAFLETAQAVADGVFRNPRWAGHSAVPLVRADS